VETTRAGASRYRNASVQADDGVTQWQEQLELERLLGKSTTNPHAIWSEEVRKIDMKLRYAAPEITTSSRPQTYIDKNQEYVHPASSHDQSTYASAEIAASSAQSSPEISYSHAAQALIGLETLPEDPKLRSQPACAA